MGFVRRIMLDVRAGVPVRAGCGRGTRPRPQDAARAARYARRTGPRTNTMCRTTMTKAAFLRTAATLLTGLALSGVIGAGVGGMGGCVGATANPSLNTRETVFNNPNAPSTWDTASTAMRWVVRRYPPQGADGRLVGWEDLDIPAGGKTYKRDGVELTAPARFIINMPVGTRRTVYDRVVDAVGLGAVGPTQENAPDAGAGAAIPIYHVMRVHVMGDEARVEILRPISTPAEAGGKALYQAVNV